MIVALVCLADKESWVLLHLEAVDGAVSSATLSMRTGLLPLRLSALGGGVSLAVGSLVATLGLTGALRPRADAGSARGCSVNRTGESTQEWHEWQSSGNCARAPTGP